MNVDPQSLITSRDVFLFGLFIAFRDGLPWLMRTVFPAMFQSKQALQAAELQMKKDNADRDFELKKDLASRQLIIEERNTKALESIERTLDGVNNLLTAIVAQIAAQGQNLSNLQSEAREYYAEGRSAIKDIRVMASKTKPKNK